MPRSQARCAADGGRRGSGHFGEADSCAQLLSGGSCAHFTNIDCSGHRAMIFRVFIRFILTTNQMH